MKTFEELSYNLEIILNIYQFLDIGDQLRLARVNAYLRNVFKSYVLKEKFPTLNISEKSKDFLIANDKQKNRLCLQSQDLLQFQELYGYQVRDLNISNTILHVDNINCHVEMKQGRLLHENLINLTKFINLKTLALHSVSISKHQMELIKENLLDLEEFSMINCWLDMSMEDFVLNLISKMKNLRRLCLCDKRRFSLSLSRWREIFDLQNLESLHITAAMEFRRQGPTGRSHSINNYQLLTPQNLKNLKIQVNVNPTKHSSNLPVFCFAQLASLCLDNLTPITDRTLTLLAENCKNLEILQFNNTIFSNVLGCPLPPKVTDLTLISCRGLNAVVLRKILSQSNIRRFKSKHSYYDDHIDILEPFQISENITSLDLDDMFEQDFIFPRESSNNMKELKWHYPWSDEEKPLSAASLSACKSLQCLDIKNYIIPLKTLLDMKSLHTLAMIQPITVYDWSYITSLLKLPNLKSLKLRDQNFKNYENTNSNTLEGKTLTTTFLEDITISLEVFELGLDFWLDLWLNNRSLKKMSCTCYPSARYDEFLKKLIKHTKFPKSMKNIIICGFAMDCKELKSNFSSAFNRLQRKTDYIKYWYDDEAICIELLR